MHVFGLDPSLTAFGWAVHDTNGTGKDRCIERGRLKTSSKMQEVLRYRYLRDSCRDILQSHPDVTRVGLETPFFGDTFSEGMYALFVFVQEALWLERRDVVYLGVSQIKAHAKEALGRPSDWDMMKADMVEETRRDTGGGRWNHNEADAYLAARMAGRFWLFYDGKLTLEDLTKYERHAFAREHTYTRGRKKGMTERDGIIFRKSERFFLWSERGEDGDEKEE